MNILFFCPFKFNLNSSNLRSLGGIESLNIELTKTLFNKNYNIYLATFCSKVIKKNNIINIPINFLLKNKSKYHFDIIVTSNDPTIFNHFKSSQKFLWLHNKITVEKAIRKRKFFSIIKNDISSIFVSKYLQNSTSNIYRFNNKYVVPNFLDPEFESVKINFNRKPHFIWSVQRTKGLKETLDLWVKDVFPNNNKFKLLIFGVDKSIFSNSDIKFYIKYNIIFKGRVKKSKLIQFYNQSLAMICLGYDETFCLNAIEAFSCGLPIITFGYTSLAELSNKKNSFIIKNYKDIPNTLIKINNLDKKIKSNLVKSCVKFSKNYKLKKILRYWKKILTV